MYAYSYIIFGVLSTSVILGVNFGLKAVLVID